MKWLETALTIILIAIVIIVVALLVTGCKVTEPENTLPPANQQSVVYADGDTTEMELVGCVEGTCTYTFYTYRRCFLTIGQANPLNAESWMFVLECPR